MKVKIKDLVKLPDEISEGCIGDFHSNHYIKKIGNMKIELDVEKIERVLVPYMRGNLLGLMMKHGIEIKDNEIEVCDKIQNQMSKAIAANFKELVKHKEE